MCREVKDKEWHSTCFDFLSQLSSTSSLDVFFGFSLFNWTSEGENELRVNWICPPTPSTGEKRPIECLNPFCQGVEDKSTRHLISSDTPRDCHNCKYLHSRNEIFSMSRRTGNLRDENKERRKLLSCSELFISCTRCCLSWWFEVLGLARRCEGKEKFQLKVFFREV